ncbi:MurR/RpiR family transcriptional regulator [Paraburkholderia atlantica]|uniref:DNA-binding MurR/RpiR family transcriptional regulator n=1 Tax=Paraburkholderia atlantica TaxID=2654982 RepID=A0A7W8Q3C1_PARAM|nr:MurR/RpiR family transcriptional regulator [Paraburkholderia atlantica]MBB5422983.1 DNA-binding MurR/RpiR family transcriptional regulator [Paraburkholderia atlantica]
MDTNLRTKRRKPANKDEASAPEAVAGAPRSVDALRELVLRIGRDEAGLSLGGKAHAVLAWLLERPEEVAVRTITDLATALDVNASTLTRLSTKLGYTGFADFQSVFRDSLAERHRHFYTNQAERLVAGKKQRAHTPVNSGTSPEVEVVVQLAHESIVNVETFLARLSADDLRGAAALLAGAPRVRVHGLRQFSALASFLCYGLGMIRADVGLLDAQGLGVAEGLAQLQPGDVVVVTSVSPYTRSVAEAAKAAAEAGMTVIAITDTLASPLVPPARHAFLIPHDSSFFSNSMGAYLIFCEGLLNLVATHLGKRSLQALSRRERLITALGIETD